VSALGLGSCPNVGFGISGVRISHFITNVTIFCSPFLQIWYLLVRDAVLVCLFHFMWGVMMWLAYVCLMADYRESSQLTKDISGGPWILFVVFARGLGSLPHGNAFAMAMYIMVFFVGEYYMISISEKIMLNILV
jgi:hypothetical protein